nr:retrovirus-related Pol polyprotein from transposon TNT 1-94 [Tanacetum cinerariifolium]
MDQDSVHMVAASKVPMLKPVIENGNAPPITQVVKGVETINAPATSEEKAQRRAKRFLKNTRRKFSMNDNETIGFDRSKTDQAEEGPTNFAFMAHSSTTSNSEVSTDSNCSSFCLENVKILKEQNEQLLKDLKTSKINAITYKTGLESIKARLLVYKKNESVYEEDIKLLKHEIHLREVAIIELRRKLELAQKQKDKIQLTIEIFENSSKNLSKLIDYQIVDKCKTSLGYNVVPPPYTGNFLPLKRDLYGLEEFMNESILSKPTVKKPIVETSEAKASTDKPKVEKKKFGPPVIEDWISVCEDEAQLKSKIKKETVKPSFAKIKFVKSKEQGNPQQDLQDKVVIDSGCSRHMIGNMSYLTNYKEITGGYVAFGGNPKRGKITGRDERRNRTLIEAAKTMLADSKLPTTFLAEAVNTDCYVQNRVLVVKPHNKTPYELFHGRTLALSFMRPFGCPVTILNTKDHLGMFDGKADEGFFVGYSLNSKAFRVFNNRTRIVEENLHIKFSENTPNIAGSGPIWLFDIDELIKSMNYKPVVAGNQSNGNAGTKACDDIGKARMEAVPGKDYILLLLWTPDPLISQESKNQEKEDNVNNTKNVNAAGTNEVNVVSENINNELPFDFDMTSLKDISTFNFSSDHDDEEAGMNNLDTTIQDERGIVIRNKARLVTQGHTQEEGIDYDEVFTLVARIEVIRLFLAYASFKDFMVYPMDVKSAFIYGNIEKEVYVCQPPGFKDPDFPDKVYKVEKALYGLHQAFRAWYEILSTYLLDNGFHKEKIDKTLFIRRHKDDILLDQVYVDDIIFGSTKKELCNAFEKMMHEKFQIGSMGELTFLLGFARNKLCLQIPQQKLNMWQLQVAMDEYSGFKINSLIMGITYYCQLKVNAARPTECEGFEQIVDFLNANPIKYALTVNPTLYTLCIEQFWATVKAKTINREGQLQALVEGKKYVKNLDNVNKVLMYPRFVQVFLNNQLEGLSNYNRIHVTPSHTKKIFRNMKRVGKRFSRRDTPLFPTMIVQAQKDMGEGSAYPTDPHHTPTIIKPSTSQPQKTKQHWKPRRTVTDVPQPSDPISVADEAVNKDIDDSLERTTTTATSLYAECQEAMRDIVALTRSKRVSKISNDLVIAEVNTPQSGKDSLKLNELMELCTKLQQRVLDLETTKTTQALKINSLKRRQEMESYKDKGLGKEDASKQGRIADIDSNKYIYLVNVHKDKDIFGVNDSDGDEVIVEGAEMLFDVADDLKVEEVFISQEVPLKEISDIDKVNVVSTATTTTATNDDITLAKALIEINSAKPMTTAASTRPKAKGLVIHEQEQAPTPTFSSQQPSHVKDKGKGKTIEPEPMKKLLKKDQLKLDEEFAFKLQAKKDEAEEERIAREKAQQFKEVNIAWDDKLKSLKKKSFVEIQELFDKAMKKVYTFVDFRTELVEESSKNVEVEITQEGSLKRVGDELEQERSKKQKVEDDKESEELKSYLEIIPDDMYLTFSKMLKKFNREDLEVRWRMVKDRFKKVKPVDHMDSFLMHNLKTMFEHHVEDNVWKNQQGLVKVKNWKLYDSCGVHCVALHNILYYLLVKKMYSLTNHTLHQMFNDVKLQVDYECKMAFELLKL